MKLTPSIVRNLYAALYCCYPFTKWQMPLPEEIDFRIIQDRELSGAYLYDTGGQYEHVITISSACCSHLYTALTILAHECIHMSFHHRKGNKWSDHGKEFRIRCKMVANELGFDPLEL